MDGYLTFRDLFQLCDAQDDVNRTLSGGAAGAGMCVTVGVTLPPVCVEDSLNFWISADGDMDELEEELKLLLDETKPGSISLLPDVPPGAVNPPGGTGLLDSLPDAPHGPISICEQLKQLTVTDAGRWIQTFLWRERGHF